MLSPGRSPSATSAEGCNLTWFLWILTCCILHEHACLTYVVNTKSTEPSVHSKPSRPIIVNQEKVARNLKWCADVHVCILACRVILSASSCIYTLAEESDY